MNNAMYYAYMEQLDDLFYFTWKFVFHTISIDFIDNAKIFYNI